MIYIGLDNGTSSNGIGVITSKGEARLYKLPVKKEPSYTKVAKNISRIDHPKLVEIFGDIVAWSKTLTDPNIIAGIERPMVNPGRFFASMSAMRAVESTLIALEVFKIPYVYLDSKEWQHVLLPHKAKGDDLKTESLKLGKSLYPSLKHKKDSDGILIAEYLRIKHTRTL